MGDLQPNYIKGAVDEVISVLKMENFQNHERKREIESLIDELDDGDFGQLVILGQ